MEFNGITARHARRRALNYWFTHRVTLGLSVTEFFRLCQLTRSGGLWCMTFQGQRRAA